MKNPKLPPQNLEAEASILGGIIVDSDSLAKAEEYLSANDFYSKRNGLIFENMIAMRDHQESIDVVTLSDRLKRQKIYDQIGGIHYLTDLVAEASLNSYFEDYCRIVKDMSQLRHLVDTSMDILNDCYGGYEQVSDLIETAESRIFKVSQNQICGDFDQAKDLIKTTMEKIQERVTNKGELSGISSGFNQLDKLTYGFQRSDLIYLAARPAMGKTALALNMASHAALKEHAKVAIFSLEMSKIQLMQRLICAEACVDMNKIRRGELEDEDWLDITNAGNKFYNSHLFIDDAGGTTISDIRSKSRRLKAEHGLDLIVIDYLQLMSTKQKNGNPYTEISEISRGLKALAREMDCPVICLSQLSRAPETRKEHQPMLSDLRDSGSIEQDADMVLFLYRDHYYHSEDMSTINEAELTIAKQRNGPTGKIDLIWRPEWTKFTNPAGNLS